MCVCINWTACVVLSGKESLEFNFKFNERSLKNNLRSGNTLQQRTRAMPRSRSQARLSEREWVRDANWYERDLNGVHQQQQQPLAHIRTNYYVLFVRAVCCVLSNAIRNPFVWAACPFYRLAQRCKCVESIMGECLVEGQRICIAYSPLCRPLILRALSLPLSLSRTASHSHLQF